MEPTLEPEAPQEEAEEGVAQHPTFASDAEALEALKTARQSYAEKDFGAAVDEFSGALSHFSKKHGSTASQVLAVPYYEYGVCLLRCQQESGDLIQQSNLPGGGAGAAAEDGAAAEPGAGEEEGEEEEANDLVACVLVLQEAQRGLDAIAALQAKAAAGDSAAADELKAITSQQEALEAPLKEPTVQHQLGKAYSAFAEALHEMNNYEVSAQAYGKAAEVYCGIAEGDELRAVAKCNQGLELKYADNLEETRKVLLEAQSILQQFPEKHKDRLEAVKDMLEEVDIDFGAVKQVTRDQVSGTCDGVAITKDTPAEKRASGPVTVLQPRKKRRTGAAAEGAEGAPPS